MRTRFPPPGAPVLVEICAPATFPCSAWSTDGDDTFATCSALTLATEFGRLRREIPVAWPLMTTWSSLSASRRMTMRTVDSRAGTVVVTGG